MSESTNRITHQLAEMLAYLAGELRDWKESLLETLLQLPPR
jgi:hypothetical protein